SANKWRMSSSSDVRHLLNEIHIFWLTTDIIIAKQSTKWGTTKSAKFFFIDFFEDRALVKLQCRTEVFIKILFLSVKHFGLDHSSSRSVIDEVLQTAPT